MDNCCQQKACELETLRGRQSNVLWIVLAINALMFVVELGAGLLSGSVALQADSLDMLGDTLVYGFSLFAVTRSMRWKAGTALLKGTIMAAFGLAVLGESVYRLFYGATPDSLLMGGTALLALAANTVCLLLLTRHRDDDLNMRSTWLCSRNDIIANSGVVLAAGAVYLSGSKLPDLAISAIITYLFLRSAWIVLREATQELRAPQPVPPSSVAS